MQIRATSCATYVLLFAAALAAQGTKRGTEIVRTDPAADRPGRRYALLIGVNEYTALPPLKTALADAQAVGATLRSLYGFETEVLANARRDDILSALNRYRRRLAPEDSILIYYAGHGHFDRTLGKAYWLPVNASPDDTTHWIISDDITTSVKALPARHVLIVSDSCFSGTLSRSAPGTSLSTGADGDRSRYLANLSKRTSRILLASGGNEPVSDSDAGGDDKHSIFAAVLLQGLEQRAPGKFTVEELFSQNVRERVAGRSGQVPECNPLLASGHDGGSFIFERAATRSVDNSSRVLELFDSMDEGALAELERAMKSGNLEAAAFHALSVCTGGAPRTPAREAALKQVDDVLAQQPGNLAALVAQPYCAQGTPRYPSVRAAWERAAKATPTDARGFLLRGIASRGLNDRPRALEDFTAALRLKPDFVQALVQRGTTYSTLNQFDSAVAEFTQALRLKPVFRAFELRALSYRNLRQYDQAVADYNEALRIRPDAAMVYFNRGIAHYDLAKYDKAIEDYSAAIRLQPTFAAYNQRGTAYLVQRKFEQAIADFTESFRLNPRYGRALINRGNAYRTTREFDKAVADYTAAIALDARDTEARDYRGLTFLTQKKFDDAIADWTESLRLDPKNIRALNFRWNAYYELKQFDRAIADCTEILRQNPNNAAALSQRARTKQAAGDAAGAQADREAAKKLSAK